jgi:chromosome segregation ATPase
MLEIVTLKQKLADLEINYTKSTKISENLQEINSQLTASNGLLKDKNLKLESKYNQLQSTLIQIEKTLEYERNTFDSKLKLLQSEIMTQQVRLKEIQDENIENLTEIHRHELQENSRKYEQEVDNLKEEVNHYKQKLTKIEDSNKQIVKSLQIEVLRAKETASRQSDELNDEKFKGFEQIIEKLENRVICIQNSMKYVIQLLSPIYEAHSNSQQDWDENQVVSQIDLNEQDYTDIIVLSEFVVFLLEKTMKDKTWLINKLQEVHSESKISKTNSVGTLASPSSFRDNGLFRQIWKDVKETSLVLEKFERCRENLVSQFIHK